MEEVFVTMRLPMEVFCDSHAPRWVSACFYQDDWDEYPIYLKFPMLFAVLPFITSPLLFAELLIALAGGWIVRVLYRRTFAVQAE
jgi:hypothetical protein